MKDLEMYFNLNVTYKSFYLKNNADLNELSSLEQIYFEVNKDMDIIFSVLNILPSKSGYLFWKDAVFLYLLQEKKKISLSKDIYPLIAKKYDVTTMCVDRSMRRCFENVLYYASKKEDNYICLFLKNIILYPHNSEILVKLVELISTRDFQQKKIKLAI